jgi:hypothetical protein
MKAISRTMPLALAAMVFLAGCGDNRIPIRGIVTFDGKPVDEGSISLEPMDGQGATTGGKIVGGKYELTGKAAPLPGKMKVRINGMRKTGRKIQGGSLASTTPIVIDEIERYIPDVYNRQTTLVCDVSANGPTQIDFSLRSK